MEEPIRVLLVDDHTMVRDGLKLFLRHDPRLQVVGEASNGHEAIEQARALHPHVILMDLVMPLMDGVAAIREIKGQHPEIDIIAVTSVLEDHKVVAAIQAGASGYLLKDSKHQELIEAIHAARRGEVRLHPEAARRLMHQLQAPNPREALTPRETEILRLIGQGLSNKHICKELDLSENTVRAHVSSILSKLGLSSRTQAALYALKEGLVSLGD
jgi:DNA-binding NarL/FixJ family response regulator